MRQIMMKVAKMEEQLKWPCALKHNPWMSVHYRAVQTVINVQECTECKSANVLVHVGLSSGQNEARMMGQGYSTGAPS